MKKYVVATIIVLVVILGVYSYAHNQPPAQSESQTSAAGADATAPEKCPTTYTSKEYRFSFKCESGESFDAFVPNSPTVGKWAVWVYDDNANNNAAAFQVNVYSSDKTLADFMAEERKAAAGSSRSNYGMGDVKNTTLGGKSALMYDFSYSSAHLGSGDGSVFWVSNGNLTYRIGIHENPNHPNEAKNFLASFTLSQ